jgi:hypothetical protein
VTYGSESFSCFKPNGSFANTNSGASPQTGPFSDFCGSTGGNGVYHILYTHHVSGACVGDDSSTSAYANCLAASEYLGENIAVTLGTFTVSNLTPSTTSTTETVTYGSEAFSCFKPDGSFANTNNGANPQTGPFSDFCGSTGGNGVYHVLYTHHVSGACAGDDTSTSAYANCLAATEYLGTEISVTLGS